MSLSLFDHCCPIWVLLSIRLFSPFCSLSTHVSISSWLIALFKSPHILHLFVLFFNGTFRKGSHLNRLGTSTTEQFKTIENFYFHVLKAFGGIQIYIPQQYHSETSLPRSLGTATQSEDGRKPDAKPLPPDPPLSSYFSAPHLSEIFMIFFLNRGFVVKFSYKLCNTKNNWLYKFSSVDRRRERGRNTFFQKGFGGRGKGEIIAPTHLVFAPNRL